MTDSWREGARSFDAGDRCPGCNGVVMFASDFKKLGKQSIRVCNGPCKAVFHNGEKVSDLAVAEA